MNKPVKTAVFPVAGLGTRFLPATKATPKEMLPIASKPLIQFAFEEAIAAGCERFVFITGRNKNSIEDHFDEAFELQSVLREKNKLADLDKVNGWMPSVGKIFFTRQRSPLGLGHAIWCAQNFVGHEPFAVLLADEMFKIDQPEQNTLKNMIEYHDNQTNPCNLVAIKPVEPSAVSQYGIVQLGKDFIHNQHIVAPIENMVEKPKPEEAPSTLALCGRYVLEPEIFDLIPQVEKGAGNEIQLTDAMRMLQHSQPFYSMQINCQSFDCGNEIGYLAANIAHTIEKYPDNPWLLKLLKHYTDFLAEHH